MEELEVTYDFSVQKADGSPWGKIGNTCKKFSPDQNSWGYGKAFSKARLIERMSELLPDGKLTIICNLEIYYDDRHTQGKKPKLDFNITDTPTLQEEISTAFTRSELSDIQLKCGSITFHCHKIILACRSDVFSAMFSHTDTKEARTNVVKIEDIDEETLEALLQFIYTDKIHDLNNFASSLLIAADKYNISRLKSLCEQKIAESIDVSNAADVLVLAHLHEADKLKTATLDFVCENMKSVSETSGWNRITESHPTLMSKVLVAMTSRLRT
uniref:Speckletype POZ proteinlike [Cricetulus griseus] n=2 Tax=Lepeophtheirus salmonis TaxID=72036 RepID=A0A0K2TV53_LEPSM